jgi:hypothetical protein
MAMDRATAERWVITSALITAAIYAYRRLTEPTASPTTAKNLIGQGAPPPLGTWATAWGFMYLGISIMAQAAPGVGGGFAILVATADFLSNGPALFSDVGKQEGGVTSTGASSTAGTPTGATQSPSKDVVTLPGNVGPGNTITIPGNVDPGIGLKAGTF